ncbi:extracellular matrix regulator RemB [Peribacillus kribbensis]|uniref:extracellular matrix regulator RemB n=1 Tax=Peribacillus kribbensis TaxID=356658 RepID=UPI00047B6F76|nr:extracellular matrix/biofilm biosynthesis regulator RemA family protein [Peribacillus kribbensis]
MYLHVGEDILVRTNDIIVILDRHVLKNSSIFQEFMEKGSAAAINLSKGEIKSIVVTEKNIYLSPLSSGILKRRVSQWDQTSVYE